MKILKPIFLLVISISSVLNQCLQSDNSGHWSLLAPIVFSNNTVLFMKLTNKAYIKQKESCASSPEDISAIYKYYIGYSQNPHPFPITYATYNIVMANANFEDGYFYDQETNNEYIWKTTSDFFLTLYSGEAMESIINGSKTRFVTFQMDNGANFSVQMIDNTKNVWTTNEPFLFLTNKSTSCTGSNTMNLPDEILNKNKWLSCTTVISSSEGDALKYIVIAIGISSIIIIVVIISACVSGKIFSGNRKQRIRKSYFKKITDHAWNQYEAYKKQKNQENESGHLDVIDIYEYHSTTEQTNKSNFIVQNQEPLKYDYVYSTFEP